MTWGRRSVGRCSLCGSKRQVRPSRRGVYGHPACKRCWSEFANRRSLAFLVDVGLVSALAFGTFSLAGGESAGLAGLLAYFPVLALFVVKDALFGGRSPGKALFGLRVVDRVTGTPATLQQAVQRTWLLLVPLLPLYLAAQMQGGDRLGERWSRTRVAWEQYGDRGPFLPLRTQLAPVPRAQEAGAGS